MCRTILGHYALKGYNFKTLTILKVVHHTLITNVPHVIIDQLNKIERDFIRNQKHPEIRYCTFCNTYENGGL